MNRESAENISQTTIVGRVPVGHTYLEGGSSNGELVVVICPRCNKPLIEYYCSYNSDQYISSDTYSVPLGYCSGSIDLGNYGSTDRVFCYCSLNGNDDGTDGYCNSGEFAICWHPESDKDDCREQINPANLNVHFDWNSFQPPLEWYQVGVMMLQRENMNESVFVHNNGIDTLYHGYCMNCKKHATINFRYD